MDRNKIIIIENRDQEFEDLRSVINEDLYEIIRYMTIQNYIDQNDQIHTYKIFIDLITNYTADDGDACLKELVTQNLKLVNEIYEKLKIQIVIITKVAASKISESMTDAGPSLCGIDLERIIGQMNNGGLKMFESDNLLILSKPYLKKSSKNDAKRNLYKQTIKNIVENNI